jgi:hypothetical protein
MFRTSLSPSSGALLSFMQPYVFLWKIGLFSIGGIGCFCSSVCALDLRNVTRYLRHASLCWTDQSTGNVHNVLTCHVDSFYTIKLIDTYDVPLSITGLIIFLRMTEMGHAARMMWVRYLSEISAATTDAI